MLTNLHILHTTDVRIVMDVDIPPAKDTTRKEQILDFLPIDEQRAKHAVLLQALPEQGASMSPFSLQHKNHSLS